MYVKTEQRASDIIENSSNAEDRQEVRKIEIIPAHNLEKIINFLKERPGKWTQTAASAIYNVLCNKFGEEVVHEAWKKDPK